MIRFVLQSERLGPLPLVNHFIQHMGLEDTLDRYVPSDQRCAVSHARTLGVLLTSAVPAWIQINRPGKFTLNCFFNLRKVSLAEPTKRIGIAGCNGLLVRPRGRRGQGGRGAPQPANTAR